MQIERRTHAIHPSMIHRWSIVSHIYCCDIDLQGRRRKEAKQEFVFAEFCSRVLSSASICIQLSHYLPNPQVARPHPPLPPTDVQHVSHDLFEDLDSLFARRGEHQTFSLVS